MGFHLLDQPNPNGPFYYTTRQTCRHGIAPDQLPHLLVIHTAESLPDFEPPDEGAEAVARYASITTRSVSWHLTVDSDSSIPMLPDSYTAFHVRDFNRCSWGVEIATRADRWVGSPDSWRYAVLDRVAAELAGACRRMSIPPDHVTRAQVDAGARGIIGHAPLDPTRRTDPGQAFPWSYVIDQVRARLSTPVVSMLKTPILGPSTVTEGQALAWLLAGAAARGGASYDDATLRRLVAAYWRIGAAETVRPEIGLAQGPGKESGFLSFKRPDGSAPPSGYGPTQWNFAGIGTTGPGQPGVSWPNLEDGVLGHLRRLRLYATPASEIRAKSLYDLAVLKRALPEDRWGAAPHLEDLDGRWAVPGVGYGASIRDQYLRPMAETVAADPLADVSPWARNAYERALAKGVVLASSGPTSMVTVERLMVFLDRAGLLS